MQITREVLQEQVDSARKAIAVREHEILMYNGSLKYAEHLLSLLDKPEPGEATDAQESASGESPVPPGGD